MATSAADVISALLEAADAAERTRVARVFKGADSETRFLGVPMRQVFGVAKRFTNLDLRNVETLLDDPHYEVRMAGVSILDFNARDKKLPPEERKAIYDDILQAIAIMKPVDPLPVQVGQRIPVLGQGQRHRLEPPYLGS